MITKSGEELRKMGAGPLAAIPAVAGWASRLFGLFGRAKPVLGRVAKASEKAFPVINMGSAMVSAGTGQQSVGGAAGEALGGVAGWSMGQRLMRRLPLAGGLKGVANIGAGLLGSTVGAGLGSKALGAVAPMRVGGKSKASYYPM